MSIASRAEPVQFLHYNDTRNIGDFLCSPRHYFEFTSDRSALIVGGGASNNFFCGRARRHAAKVRIAWAIGQSWAMGVKPSLVDQLLKAAKRRLTYAKASTRDPLLASDQLPLVPCVSVFHPVTEIPVGSETGIFLNSDENVSGTQDALRDGNASAAYPHAFIATNGMHPDEFLGFFGRAGTIVTNSYHAAYWGLLSGRSVHMIGYSTKFTNLAALFGFPESSVIRVKRGDSASLRRAIAGSADREPLRLDRPDDARSRFRQHNLDFARSLGGVGVLASLKSAYAEKSRHAAPETRL